MDDMGWVEGPGRGVGLEVCECLTMVAELWLHHGMMLAARAQLIEVGTHLVSRTIADRHPLRWCSKLGAILLDATKIVHHNGNTR